MTNYWWDGRFSKVCLGYIKCLQVSFNSSSRLVSYVSSIVHYISTIVWESWVISHKIQRFLPKGITVTKGSKDRSKLYGTIIFFMDDIDTRNPYHNQQNLHSKPPSVDNIRQRCSTATIEVEEVVLLILQKVGNLAKWKCIYSQYTGFL